MDTELTEAEVETLSKLVDDVEKLNKQLQRFAKSMAESSRIQAAYKAPSIDKKLERIERPAKVMPTPKSESESKADFYLSPVKIDRSNNDADILDVNHTAALVGFAIVAVTDTDTEVTSNRFSVDFSSDSVLDDARIGERSFETKFCVSNNVSDVCLLPVCENASVYLPSFSLAHETFNVNWCSIQLFYMGAVCPNPPWEPPDDVVICAAAEAYSETIWNKQVSHRVWLQSEVVKWEYANCGVIFPFLLPPAKPPDECLSLQEYNIWRWTKCWDLALSSIQKGLILSSNWQGQLNTIKADAKGSKEEIYSSRVKYMFKEDQPYIWVPEDNSTSLSNVAANMQQLSLEKDDHVQQVKEETCIVVISDHLQVQSSECLNLTFGSFGAGIAAGLAGTSTADSLNSDVEEQSETEDASAVDHSDFIVFKLVDFIKPEVITYRFLIEGFCNAGDLIEACKLFNLMADQGVGIDVCSVEKLMETMLKQNQFSEAFKLFQAMSVKYSCNLGLSTYKILIHWLCKRGIKADNATLSYLVYGHLAKSSISEAYGVLEGIKKPEINIYHVLIKGLLRLKKPSEATQVFRAMIRQGCEPTMHTYIMLLQGHMGKRGRKGDDPLVNFDTILVGGLVNAGKSLEATKYVERVMDREREVPTFDYNKCLHYYSNDEGVLMFEDMELIAAAKADPIAPFNVALIDGINQSEIKRRALMLLCLAHFNANVRDAFLLSVDRT